MPVVDLTAVGVDRPLALAECDVCIIGTGPAGSTIARELSSTSLRVTILESGGFHRCLDTDALNEVENIGRPRVSDQWEVRNRIVGGSSHTWGGRCAPFDEIDFEMRPWVPGSGWPFEASKLGPYLERSASHLGLAVGNDFSDERFWRLAGRKAEKHNLDPAKLLPFFWQFSRDSNAAYDYMRFGRRLVSQLGANVTLVTGASVLRAKPCESGQAIRSIEFAALDGRRRTLTSPVVILCAGGIENARILLASDSVNSKGLGNDRDLVGRYLMDHPRGPIGSFDLSASEPLQRRFGLYNARGNLFRGGFRLSPDVQRTEGLLNCAAWLGGAVAEDDPWEAGKRFIRGAPELPGDLIALISNAGIVFGGLRSYAFTRESVIRKLSALNLDCMCEQRPDPDSRVTLSDRRDRFGTRLPRIDWRVHEDESRTMRRMAELAAEQLERMRLPPLDLANWVREGAVFPPTFVDVAHPTGTTRMSEDPTRGVVDANCRVHGVEGLYVAGSSVFPTSGHSNPTQMIVALAIRLADHLKARRWETTVKLQRPGQPLPTSTRVLVTGATGGIGRFVVADLLERGYAVRATTRASLPENAHESQVEWRRFDFYESTDYDELIAGCDAVLHIAAEMKNPSRMWRTNVEATELLARAAERAGVKAFCYTSSVAVYGSGKSRVMSEDSRVLTIDKDIRSEYWGDDAIRIYGRSKLGGERALRNAADHVRYVVYRPTVVVDTPHIIGVRDWSFFKRNIAAHRHAHYVYIRDVSDAIIWGMERALSGSGRPGSVDVFNLSEDDYPEPTHAQFMRKAYAASGDPRYRVAPVPWIADWLRDFLRFRRLPLRNPLWRMRFPNDRLRAVGYNLRFGMAYAAARALDELRKDVHQSSEPAIGHTNQNVAGNPEPAHSRETAGGARRAGQV